MKYLAAFFSLITLLSLFGSLNTNNEINISTEKQFNVPNKINPIAEQPQLNAEKDWLAYLSEPETPEVETPKVETDKKSSFPVLTIGDKNYQLLGIFKQQQPFILVKGVGTDLVKLQEGDELSDGITLQKITPSAIIILHGKKTIEFKLFERSDHGK